MGISLVLELVFPSSFSL